MSIAEFETKNLIWEETLAATDQIADGLGRGIDESIKRPVAALMLHGFTTSSSCEGHIPGNGEEEGLPYPWIEIYSNEPDGWKQSEGHIREQLEQQWRTSNLNQQLRLMDLLAEFYDNRITAFDARLVFDPVGIFGGFRIRSFGSDLTALFEVPVQVDKRALYRQEFHDFTEFLIKKYFAE